VFQTLENKRRRHVLIANYCEFDTELAGSESERDNRLLANDFSVGAGGDDADEAPGVEIEVNFEIFRFHHKLFKFRR
jgi:hypothetical protein